MQAINRRKRTFLEKEEWLTLPWSKHPGTKTPHHRILDILCPVPGLLEDFDTFENVGFQDEELRAKCRPLWEKAKELMIRLFRWRWEWEASHDGPVAYEVPVDPTTSWTVDGDLKPLFPSVLYFQSLEIAKQLTIYNSAVSILMTCGHMFNVGVSDIAEKAHSSLPLNEEPLKVNPLTMPHRGTSIYLDGTKETLRTVDYYLLERHRNQGAFSLLWPLRMRYTITS